MVIVRNQQKRFSDFRLAKKYAEQNAKLKLKLKEVKNNYASMLEKNKKKGEEFIKQSENSKAGMILKSIEKYFLNQMITVSFRTVS